MTEQEKREKVIGELELCLDDAVAAVVPSGTVQDAIDLMKAQEPRVMTLEDVLQLRFNDVVYFEMVLSKVAIPAIVIDVIDHMPDGEIGLIQFRHIQEPTNNADLEYYGKTWRCWTSRPTEKQRQAVKWD